jgi:poly-gamma-glutamate capsule biosynthesis protein CapA/YwtB (metallophosphatase superfamily)
MGGTPSISAWQHTLTAAIDHVKEDEGGYNRAQQTMSQRAQASSFFKGILFALSQKPLVFIACLVLLIASCGSGMDESLQAPLMGTTNAHATATLHSPSASETPTLIPTVSTSPTPQPVVLAVPAQWSEAALGALEEANAHDGPWLWKLDIREDTTAESMLRAAQVSLVIEAEGIPCGQRPLALVVPFTSQWESVTSEEAQHILSEGSPFIAAMDWADMPVTHKALKVDGLHPGDPNYPLLQSWSLISATGYEAAATELAPILRDHLTEDAVIQLSAVGDVMLDRALGEAIRAGDVTYPFAEVIDLLTSANLTVGNLESALGDVGSPTNKGYTFRAPPEASQALAQAGFDLLSLANNHALDYGPLALQQAMDLLHQQQIATVGAGADETAAHEPHVREINGLTLAFLAYVHVPVEVRGFDTQTWTAATDRPGMAWADLGRIQVDVATALDQVDLVIVLLHSGYENISEPSSPQVAAAHAAIEAGASLVIGHHAHVLQGVEFYGEGVIVYGLGNFAFEDGGPPESAVLNVWLDGDGVRMLEFVPVVIETDGHPRPAIDEEVDTILHWIYDLTEALNRP